MTPNQHCQHFASSLGQGRAHPSASPPPRSDPTLGHSGSAPACLTPAGTGSLGSQRAEPRRGPAWPAVALTVPHEACPPCC